MQQAAATTKSTTTTEVAALVVASAAIKTTNSISRNISNIYWDIRVQLVKREMKNMNYSFGFVV